MADWNDSEDTSECDYPWIKISIKTSANVAMPHGKSLEIVSLFFMSIGIFNVHIQVILF